MKTLATFMFLLTCVLSAGGIACAQDVIPVESVSPINLEVPEKPPTSQLQTPMVSPPKLPSLWIPGGILLGGLAMIAAGTTMMVLADFNDGLWIGGISLVSIGSIALVVSAFVGTAFSARRKVIKQYLNARRATFSASGFSLRF